MSKIEHAFALVDKANILGEMGSTEKYQRAIEYQEKAISTNTPIQIYWSTRTTTNRKRSQNSTPPLPDTSKRPPTQKAH
jgi:hypothetical protein